MIATITYRPNAQKTPGLYDTILADAVLKDICQRITGQNHYRVVRDLSTYNKGRLVLVEYHNVIYYVSLSGTSVSAPMIAGICAIILQKYPYFKPEQVKKVILQCSKGITYNRNLEGMGYPVLK